MQHQEYINHEVRIQLTEKLIEKFDIRFEQIDNRFQHLENKIDSQFKWVIGTMIGVLLASLGTTISIVCVLLTK